MHRTTLPAARLPLVFLALALTASIAKAQTTVVNFSGSSYISVASLNPTPATTNNALSVIGDSNLDGRRIVTLAGNGTVFPTYVGGPQFDIAAEAISYSAGSAATHPNSGALSFRGDRLDPVAAIPGIYDTMRFAVTSSATGTAEDVVHGVMLFNLSATYSVAEIKVSFNSDTAIALTTGTLRYAVKSGGTVYLSQNTVSLSTALNSDTSVTDFSLSGLNWQSYNTSGIGTGGIFSPATFTALPSDDITQVGFYVDLRNSTNTAGNPAGIAWDLVTYTAAVPEPSTYAAILGLAAFGLIAYRRRQSPQT